MKYATACSGIDAPAVAWNSLGWEQVFSSEIEKFPSEVLKHHAPDVPNYGDMTNYKEWPDHDDLGLICGGTPCQSFSIAGLRKGLDDPRGNLALTFIGLVDRYRPRWVLWENVPGVLSSSGGEDLQAFLDGMAVIGYFGAWRVLDAQWFGVAQRRRRVFAVFCPGDWRRAAAVLLEPESLRGDSPPSRETGQRVADSLTVGANQCSGYPGDFVEDVSPTIPSRSTAGGGLGTDFDCDGGLIPSHDPSCTLTARDYKGPLPEADLSTVVAHPLLGKGNSSHAADKETYIAFPSNATADGAEAIGENVSPTVRASHRFARNGRGAPSDIAPTLTSEPGQTGKGDSMPCVFSAMPMNSGKNYTVRETDVAQPLTTVQAGNHAQGGDFFQQQMGVRRLTPRECERLQGFPDDYTLIPTAKARAIEKDYFEYLRAAYPEMPMEEAIKLSKDGPRYKALGNSMAVPVLRWIGERIQQMEEIDAG